ncbi:MAG: hypothetical protein RIC55_15690 [Pirellulaceae bacterium]
MESWKQCVSFALMLVTLLTQPARATEDAPQPFSGQELATDASIPPDVEARLKSSDVQALCDLLLTYPQARVRGAAAQQLGKRDDPDEKRLIVPVLRAALGDPDIRVAIAAAQQLATYGPLELEAVELLLTKAKVEGSINEADAKWFHKNLGDAAPQIVADWLKHNSVSLRRFAVQMIRVAIEGRARQVQLLTAALEDDDPQVRRSASVALEEMGETPSQLLKAFVSSLGQRDDWKTESAIRKAGRKAIPLLIDVVLDEQASEAQRRAAVALLPPPSDFTGAAFQHRLRQGLQSTDEGARQWAAIALGTMRRHPAAAPVLTEAASNAANPRRIDALRALKEVRFPHDRLPDETAAALMTALKDKDRQIAEIAVAIIHTRQLGESHLPALLTLLEDEDTRQRAVQALEKGALVHERLVPMLASTMRADPRRAGTAGEALVYQGMPGVTALIDVLCHWDSPQQARFQAAATLTQVVPPPPDEQRRVEALLKDDNKRVQQMAAVTLAAWGYDWDAVEDHVLSLMVQGGFYEAQAVIREHGADDDLVDKLLELAENERSLKLTIYELLPVVGPTSRAGAEAVLRELNDDAYGRKDWGELLGRFDDVGLQTLVSALQEAKGGQREWLIEAIRDAGRERNASRAFIQVEDWAVGLRAQAAKLVRGGLSAEATSTRRQSALTLPYVDAQAQDAVAPLVNMLSDREVPDELRAEAIDALRQLGPRAVEAIPPLTELLESELLSADAFYALQSMGPAAAPMATRLAELLSSEQHFDDAAATLASIGPKARSAVPALLAQLHDARHIGPATHALRAVGASAEQVLPLLYQHLRDPHTCCEAAAALGIFGDRSAIPELKRLLEGKDVAVQIMAVSSLGALKAEASLVADAIIPFLTGDTEELRFAAVNAFGASEAADEVAVPLLMDRIADDSMRVRFAAAYWLGTYERQAAPAVPALTAALYDPDNCSAAANALGRLGPVAASAVPALVEMARSGSNRPTLKRQYHYLRRIDAIRALGSLGDVAAEAAPALIELYGGHVDLRPHIATALWEIDPESAQGAGIKRPTTDARGL